MRIALRALCAFPFDGRDMKPGQEFSASKRDAHILISIGHAQMREHYETRVITQVNELDGMSLDDLRALAARLGVRVHHRAGAEKLRSAIKEARG